MLNGVPEEEAPAPTGAPLRDKCGPSSTKHGMRIRFKSTVTPRVRLWSLCACLDSIFCGSQISGKLRKAEAHFPTNKRMSACHVQPRKCADVCRVSAHDLHSPDDFFNDLVFFNDTEISAHLGCPHASGQVCFLLVTCCFLLCLMLW